MRRPLFPTVGSNPDEQRLRAGLSELVSDLLRQNVFQTRLLVQRPLVSATVNDPPVPLAWGSLNRVALLASGYHVVALPRIRSDAIGMPLLASFRYATGAVARLVAKPPALVNRSPTGMLVASGITLQAVTDGVDWMVY